MKKITFAIILLTSLLKVSAQGFEDFFTDQTLRIDYTFSGDAKTQHIAIDQLYVSPHWYGKKRRLTEVPAKGNGQIVVQDHRSGTVIYKNSFSTLFQEWLSYPEASHTKRSFENVFLTPMPRDTVDITISLFNNRQEVSDSFKHMVSPTDILIRHIGNNHITPYEVVQQPNDTTRCIDIAFIAEGYKASEMPVFMDDVHAACDAIFQHEPFKSCKDRFRIVAVKSISKDSGTSIPHKGIWKHTVLNSHFDTFYSDRYLTTLHLSDMHNLLAGIPYEHIIVLVNTDNYGGGGIFNSYNLSMAHHEKFRPVIVHEFGHSFAGLADEYAYENEDIPMYPHDVEPWEKNITTRVNFASKWQDMIGRDSSIGLFEGAGYSTRGIYRPCADCRMRTNEEPEFCPVCQQAIINLIDFYTK